MRLFRGSAAPPGKGNGREGGEVWGEAGRAGGQRGFSPPSPPPPPPKHSSCCAGSGGGLHPRPRSSAGCAGALSAYSLKWEIRALRNGECAAGARARVCPSRRACVRPCALSRSPPRCRARAGAPGSPSVERRPRRRGHLQPPGAGGQRVPPRPPPPPVPRVRGAMRTPVTVPRIAKARRAGTAARRGDAGCHERG